MTLPAPVQLTLDGYRPPVFCGWTYREELDRARLTTQLQRVLYWLLDGREHSIPELARLVGGSETGVSARLRQLRDPRQPWGGFDVRATRVAGLARQGAWRYRLVGPRREQVDIVFGMEA